MQRWYCNNNSILSACSKSSFLRCSVTANQAVAIEKSSKPTVMTAKSSGDWQRCHMIENPFTVTAKSVTMTAILGICLRGVMIGRGLLLCVCCFRRGLRVRWAVGDAKSETELNGRASYLLVLVGLDSKLQGVSRIKKVL